MDLPGWAHTFPGDVIFSHEARMFDEFPGVDNNPVLHLLLRHRAEHDRLLGVELPYSPAMISAVGGPPRGIVGRFVAHIAQNMSMTPTHVLRRQWEPVRDPDFELVVATMTADAYVVKGRKPEDMAGVTDFADLPADHRHDGRMLLACDGRGWSFEVYRYVEDGQPGELAEATRRRCVPDVKPGRFCHGSWSPHECAVGLVPWALAVIAETYRSGVESV